MFQESSIEKARSGSLPYVAVVVCITLELKPLIWECGGLFSSFKALKNLP